MEMVVFWLLSSLMAGLCFCSEQTVRCESQSYKRKECPVGGVYDKIEKTSQLSSVSCIFGYSFGTGDDYVWVDNGCRAVFTVTFPATTHNVESTTHGAVSTTHGVESTTHGAVSTTHGVESTTHGAVSTTHGVESTTHGAVSTTNFIELSTHFVGETTNGVWMSATAGETTSNADIITSNDDTPAKEDVTTTKSSQYDTTQSSGNSGCHGNTDNHEGNCECRTVTIPTLEEQMTILRYLRRTLRVNKTQLSSFIRKRVSATDTRLSSRAIGFAGVVILLLILGTIITSDFLSVYRHIMKTRR